MNTKFVAASSAAVLSLLTAVDASAQRFNVDLQQSPSAVPPVTYGGYDVLDQIGLWNAWTPVSTNATNTIALFPVTGPQATIPVTASTSTLNQGAPMAYQTDPFGDPEMVALYDDYLRGAPGRVVDIENLLPGDYLVTIYSWRAGGGARWRVSTPSAFSPYKDLDYTFSWPGPYRDPSNVGPGHSMAQFELPVEIGETLSLEALCEGGEPHGPGGEPKTGTGTHFFAGTGCVLNGFQLTPLVGDSFCPQPPNSDGLEMRLVAWGTSMSGDASFGANDLVLAVGVVGAPLPTIPNTPATVVLPMVSDDVLIPGAIHGCPRFGPVCIGTPTGGNIHLMPAGFSQTDHTYSAAVDFSTLPAMWMVGAGKTLNFQCYYRDLTIQGECSGPGQSIVRLTNALQVTLIP